MGHIMKRWTITRALLGVTLALSFVALTEAPAAAATVRHVAVTGSDTVPVGNACTSPATPCRTIAWALAVAQPGDTILLGAGTYVERPVITKGVTIEGAGAGQSFIDGNSTETAGAPVVVVNLAVGQPTLTISGVTMRHGYSVFGAGLQLQSGTVVINDSAITDNRAGPGAAGGAGIGVLGRAGGTTQHLTLNRVTIAGNTATSANGGAIWSAGPIVINDSTITGNRAIAGASSSTGIGGGIFLAPYVGTDTPTIELHDSTVSGNSATSGGGAYIGGGATLTVTGGSIEGNDAVYGAGVLNSGTTTVTGGRIAANTAGYQGGGVWNGSFLPTDAPSLTLTDTEVDANTSAFLGGGVLGLAGSTTTVLGGEFTENEATSAGGLYLQFGATADVDGATFERNRATAGNGGGIWASGHLTLERSALYGNTAEVVVNNTQTGNGGALHLGRTVASDAPSATITGSTFASNVAWAGGAIGVFAGATLDVGPDTVISSNTSAYGGGGIYNAGTVTLDGTTLDHNDGGYYGGAIHNGSLVAADTPTMTADGVVLTENTAVVSAGGILVGSRASLVSTGATLRGNTASNAGGLHVQAGGMTHLSGADAAGNEAIHGYGGFAFNSGELTIDHSTLRANRAVPNPALPTDTGLGGAVYSASTQAGPPHTLRIDASTLIGNEAGAGSAIVATSPVVLTRSTLTGNATTVGAGAVVTTGLLTIAESTVVDNTATSGAAGIYGFGTTGIAGSIVAGNAGGDCALVPADGGHNLAGDATCGFPVADPQLGPLGPHGGPTPDREPLPTSPAINVIPVGTATGLTDAISGVPVVLCAPGTLDQRGVPRPQGSRCDVGAVEVGNEAPTIDGPDSATFVAGAADSVGFTTTGVPAPDLTVEGELPAGVTFVDHGDGTASLSGSPENGTGGIYPVTITAANGTDPDATKAFTLVVHQAPAIVAPASATFTVGLTGSVVVQASGHPAPALAVAGALPDGVTFVDHGDGTATLGGVPDAGTDGDYPLTIVADNGVGLQASSLFHLTVAPALQVTTEALPAAEVGVAYHAALAAGNGAPAYTWSVGGGSLPAGLVLHPDGTITGTPTGPAGTATFTATVTDSGDPQQSASRALSITVERGATTLVTEPVVLSTSGGLVKVTVGRVSATLTGGVPRKPIAGQAVTFRAGGTTVCTASTNAAGLATCTLSVTSTLAVILSGGVTAQYAGTTSWRPASAAAGIL